ncbi:hypothetical protein TWF481_004216 [Arthrobotrys musiformis]|uniref:Uncharacterized protein n=1 Tax=Arthrobotrys musiformis TaxID=47236 RepID=A0AAV9WIW7_9PEZI
MAGLKDLGSVDTTATTAEAGPSVTKEVAAPAEVENTTASKGGKKKNKKKK